jgi:N-acetylglucosamine malate deacetylase 2
MKMNSADQKVPLLFIENASRLLVFVAHPDDEVIGCGVLLQRVPSALVVFAVDGAPTGYGFERKFGSLAAYSELRFREASLALALAKNCSFRRLQTPAGASFPDRSLFQYLDVAEDSLLAICREYRPDAVVSHAFEGGHVDHDTCSLLAKRVAKLCSVEYFEFPLYWKEGIGDDVFQWFRDTQPGENIVTPSEAESITKKKMIGEYKTQANLMAVFCADKERFRRASSDHCAPSFRVSYDCKWRSRRFTKEVLKRFSEFDNKARKWKQLK